MVTHQAKNRYYENINVAEIISSSTEVPSTQAQEGLLTES